MSHERGQGGRESGDKTESKGTGRTSREQDSRWALLSGTHLAAAGDDIRCCYVPGAG